MCNSMLRRVWNTLETCCECQTLKYTNLRTYVEMGIIITKGKGEMQELGEMENIRIIRNLTYKVFNCSCYCVSFKPLLSIDSLTSTLHDLWNLFYYFCPWDSILLSFLSIWLHVHTSHGHTTLISFPRWCCSVFLYQLLFPI